MHHLNSCNHIGEHSFRVMFPNSVEAENFKLGRTKFTYFVNFGFAPYFSDSYSHLCKIHLTMHCHLMKA